MPSLPCQRFQVKYNICCSGRRIWQDGAAIFGGTDSAGRWVTGRYLVPHALQLNHTGIPLGPPNQGSRLWAVTSRLYYALPSNEHLSPRQLVRETSDSGIQDPESHSFELVSIFGSPAKRRIAAQPGIKWRPSHFPSFPACRPL